MTTVATDFGMTTALKQLGVKDINEGTSTGLNNFSSVGMIASHSPLDGELIGKVKTTTRADLCRGMVCAITAVKGGGGG